MLPIELEREIFETMALMFPRKAPKLLVVSHYVFQWIEPLLYRVLRTDHAPTSTAIHQAMATQPPEFLRGRVRHLYFDWSWMQEDCYLVLDQCTAITSFAATLHFSPTRILPLIDALDNLHYWNSSMRAIFGELERVDLSRKGFQNITHMHMFDLLEDEHLAMASQLLQLPRLTHLALNNPPDLISGSLLRGCRHLLVFNRILTQSVTLDQAREMANKLPFEGQDERYLVSLFPERYWDDWTNGAFGGEDIWTRAEDFLAKKRRGEISASCYLLEARQSREDCFQLLALCSNLHSFAWTGPSFAALSPVRLLFLLDGYPNLQYFNGSLNAVFGSANAFDLGHSAFRNITHMHVFEIVEPDDLRIPIALTAVPRLTHLALNSVKLSIARYSEGMPSLAGSRAPRSESAWSFTARCEIG
ncbi:hypothetical protein MIND_00612400 [Mycena indigotica]|uniref:Uncharacterized protein n=1 Tax=Mycena indigotica TaxID=2126181 RepID=A0A8H6W5R9_9AGAR|nr:uncharacterized protein MIND_00612400 [Mycena indigotica]KAF7303826.1 hypothetical protein MIND_00612400 [Mycena indigotica]